MAVDWSQFKPLEEFKPSVDWSQFKPLGPFDDVVSGGSSTAAPSFDNVESGSESASLMYDGTRRPDDVPAPRPLVEPARAQSDVPNATRREDMFGEEPDQFVVQAEEWGPAAWVKQLFGSPVGQAIRDTPPVRAASDLGFTAAGGLASGAGSVIGGVEHQFADDRNSVFGGVSLGDDMSFEGDALSQLAGVKGPRDEIVQDPNQIPDAPLKPSRLATALKAAGKEASGKSSPEFQQQRKDSVFKGDVRDPSTYDIGDNWSPMGVAGNVVDTLGQMAAPLALSAVPGVGTPLATGAFAAQSSSGAYEDNYDYVMSMKPEALARSERYQDLIKQGQSPGQAQMTLADIAGRDSMDIAALIGSLSGPILGGTVTRPIAEAMERKFGQSFGARLLGNAAEMPLEAISESGETLVGRTMANKDTGINRDVGEGTFNDAIMGMTAAAGPAVVGSIGENDGLTPEQRYTAKLKEKLEKGRAGKIVGLPDPRPEISSEDVTAKAFNTLKRLDEMANGSEDGSRPPVELTPEQENLRQFLGENIGNPEMLAAGMGHKLTQPGVVQGDVKEEGVPERITEAQARGFTPEPLMNLGERASTPESDAMDAGAAATSAIFQAAGASSTSADTLNQGDAEVKPFDPVALLKDLENDGPAAGSETVDTSDGPVDILGKNVPNAQNTDIKKSKSRLTPFEGMSKEEFLGDPVITSNKNAADLTPKALTTVASAESVPFKDGLTARYSEDGAAVYDGDQVVASYNFGDTLVVDPKYRRNGIAEELVYQWRTRNPNAKPAKYRTKASQAIQEKVWDRIQGESQNSGIKKSRRPDAAGLEVNEDVELTEEELAAFNRQSAPKKEDAKKGDNVLEGWTGIATNPDAFKHGRSEQKAPGDIARDIEPGYTIVPSADLAEGQNVPSEKAWKITTPEGTEAELHQSKGEVWVNVAGLEEGEGGSRIYNLAANYAHNNGLKFVGDPNGISDVALKRRPEQMLSSALKFGTTEHLGPQDQQLVAHPEIGLSALNWKEGDHAHNIRELARLTSEATAKEFPEIADIRYNPETLKFERPDGTEVTNGDFKKLAVARRAGPDAGNSESGQDGAVRVSPTAGRRSLKRAVITQQLASPEGAALARLLAGDGGRGAKHTPGQSLPGLSEILYSRSEDQGGSTAPAQKAGQETDQQAEAKNVAAEEAAAKVLGRKEIEALKENAQLHFITVKQALALGINGLKSAKDIKGVNGFYDPKTGNVYVLSDSGLKMKDLHGIVVHEIVHSNMDKLLGTDGFQSVIESLIYEALVNEDPEAMAAVKEAQTNEANKSEADRKEEALAYYAQQNPDSPITKKMVDEGKLFLNRLGFSLKYLNANKVALRKIIALNLKHAQRADKGRPILTEEQARAIIAMINAPENDDVDMKFQRAFHGTHARDIEQTGFKLNKIGTGEGAQAYGYGMYFAGNKDIAEHYRETLAADGFALSDGSIFNPSTLEHLNVRAMARRGDIDGAIAKAKEIAATDSQVSGHAERDLEVLQGIKESGGLTDNKGQLYHAEIPEDSDLLDYDKPWMDQPEKVKAALSDDVRQLHLDSSSGKTLYEGIVRINGNDAASASEYLNGLGIPGLRYLDGVSRNRPLKDIKREFLAELPEDADFAEVNQMVEDGKFSPKNAAVLKALEADDWLGFDYPAQALSAALSKDLSNYDASPALTQAVSDAQEGGSHNYVIWDENLLTPEKAQITPYYSKRAPEGGNKHGFIPALQDTAKGKLTLPDKPLFTQATNNKNAEKQIDNIDVMLKKFPNPEDSVNDWNRMMAYALADKVVPVAPYRMIETINGKGYGDLLSKMSPGQIEDRRHGFENGAEFREMYEDGTANVITTGKLSLWSFLSRGVSPYVQESLFMDSVGGIEPWIKLAAEGKFDEAALERYTKWSDGIAPAKSGLPGSGAKHNLNAFGRSFLFNMSQPGKDGKPRLQHLHELIADFNNTGPEIRREFAQFGEGVGIDNKVVSFTLLVSGRTDVMVLDRVQIKGLWDDGRFKDRNLYDGEREDDPSGKTNKKGEPIKRTVSGSKLADLFSGARGLAVYEAIERSVARNLDKWYTEAGRPEDASLGGFHWDTWVSYSAQEASHGTIQGIMQDAAGKEAPYQGITAKEGEYGGYAYGTRYGLDPTGQPYFLYNTSDGTPHHFTVPNFREFLDLVKKPSSKVRPSKFLVTKDENGNDRTAPWYDDPRVNRSKLDALVERFGTPQKGERPVSKDDRQPDADGAGSDGVKFSRRNPKADTSTLAPDDFSAPVIEAPKTGETWYHGRPEGAREFADGRPAFFARDKEGANWFAQDSGSVSEHTVSAKNPARIRDFERIIESLGYELESNALAEDISKNSPYGGENTVDAVYIPAVRKALEKAGFDSVLVHDTIENGSTEALIVWNKDKIDSPKMSRRNPQTETPAFKKWFGDSKVVDADGAPLVVYRGDFSGQDVFDGSGRKVVPEFRGNIFFTTSEKIAGRYSRGEDGGDVYPTYLSIKNPLTINASGDSYSDLIVPKELAKKVGTKRSQIDTIAIAAKDSGYDGLVVLDVGDQYGYSDQYVAFRPEQIKSATGNNGDFDTANPSIIASRRTRADAAVDNAVKRETARNTLGGPTTGGAVGWDFDTGQWVGLEGDWNRARAKLDDSMLAWRHVQDRIAESTGSLIPDAQNVYRLQNLMHGRVSEGVKQLEDKHIEPLVKAMDRAGLSVKDVESYMHARHAEERNKYIAKHRPGMPDGGSGMTTKQANDILAKLKSPEMDAIARRLDAIMRQTRRRLLDHGIITQEQFDAMNAQYSKYVPLRGKEQEENEFEAGKSPGGVGRGLDGRQAPFKKAFGRGTGNMPINILGEIFGDAQRSIIAAEKARVGRAVLRIILANPNPNLWTVEPVQTKMAQDDAGQIYEAVVNDWSDPSIIGIRHKGVIYKVEIKNAPLANALMGMAPETMAGVVRASAYVQRYLSAVLTKYNPAFMPVNLIRDLVFGATGVFADHGVVATGRVAAGYLPAMRAGWRHARGTLTNSAIDQRFQEYVNAGGRTGFVNPQNAEQIQKKLGAWRVDGYNPKNAAKVLRGVADFTGDVNDMVENALRFSAFNMLMDQGWTAEKAAEYAKNITVNFNRKGSRASLLGAFFLFYNPGVQGTKAVGRMLRKPKTWAVLGAISSIQLLLAMAAAGDEDDDGNNAWDMLPDYVKRRSLCFAWFDDNGEHKYISIPMSYGFNVFPYLTGRAFDMAKNQGAEKNRPAAVTGDVALAMLESFSPVPVEDGPLGLLPPIMGIPTQVQVNKGDFGRSIRNENMYGKYDKPLSVQGKAKTSSVFKTGATILNRLGGGDDNTKPWPFLDYAPEDLEFMFKKLGGGAGSFAADVGGLIEKAVVFGVDELTPRDFPISKRLYSTVEEGSMQQGMYYDRRAQIEKSADIVRKTFETEGQDAAQKLLDSTPALEGAEFKKYKTKTKDHKKGQVIVIDGRPQLVAKDEESIYAQYKAASKATMDLNERINDSYTGPDRPFPQWLLPDREAEQKGKDLMDQRMEAQKKFNATWNTRIDSFLSE